MSDTDDFSKEFDFEVDPKEDEVLSPLSKGRTAVIRTSDRIAFKRCRRRWNWSSHLRENLGTRESQSPLWFGTGFHFAMEDFHSVRNYSTPVEAFEAYVKATYKQHKIGNKYLPYDWPELVVLGRKMLEYYANDWLVAREPLRTYVHNGVPQVEVHALVPIPLKHPDFDSIYYGATLDRVVEDEDGWLWIVDYKTAKTIQTQFFQTDPQVTNYCWIAKMLYGKPIRGFIYQQHRKAAPDDPRVLSSGKVSTAKGLLTSHRHYRRALINIYGDVLNAPTANVDYLNELAMLETTDADKFIRRDRIRRNEFQIQAEGEKILMEVEDMLNPNLPLYPNPTRECGHLCSFNNMCISMDDGGDWEEELRMTMQKREYDIESWRKFLPVKTEVESAFK